MTRSAPRLTVVVPAFDEAERLKASLPPLLDEVVRRHAELIIVDDGSDDDTRSVASALVARLPRAKIVSLARHCGKGAAVRAGVAEATGDAIVFMDADLATDLRDLDPLLNGLRHAHVAIGSRAMAGATTSAAELHRVYMGHVFNRVVRVATGLPFRDTQCGFKAFRRPVAKVLFRMARIDGFGMDVEILTMAKRLDYRIVEVPVHWHAVGHSHVRPIRDSAVMAGEVLRASAHWTSSRVHNEALLPIAGDDALRGDGYGSGGSLQRNRQQNHG